MEEEHLSTADLLAQWREATRAAELADRLATLAEQAAQMADRNVVASEEIAQMAERAARAAERAASTARKAATKAKQFAADSREVRLHEANAAVTAARDEESLARDRYHEAERQARDRQDDR